jgi:hypothetical protein
MADAGTGRGGFGRGRGRGDRGRGDRGRGRGRGEKGDKEEWIPVTKVSKIYLFLFFIILITNIFYIAWTSCEGWKSEIN